MTASDFSSTPYGQLLLAFTSFFLNLLLTLVVGVILNIVSVCQYKLYLRGKKQRDEAYKRASNPGKSEQVLKRQEMTMKEANERKAEKNLLFMALTLSSISILSRILFNALLCVLYFVLPDFHKRIIACTVYFIYTLFHRRRPFLCSIRLINYFEANSTVEYFVSDRCPLKHNHHSFLNAPL